MTLTVTTIYAVPFALLMLVLWMGVTKTRASAGISIGDGGNTDLHERIRRHGNFIEWVPLTLVLLALAEIQGTGVIWLHLAGSLALLGRLVHPFGLSVDRPGHPLRIVGNLANLIATLILIVALIRASIGL